ncbi:hypothetical protein EIL87_13890 [Saccharopolyspora rhizosphaerae]|uniref:Uncharacterized protein n=1 Tax=Saccharopolyspora rhizosphaerae TaxID=2492662 RepID=A0A426JSS0_9PSEU|nr:hypothetical protein [Saccharopolyspora rhizosphaerae]RRO16144.1 hypothetical protein EIL87_13890 [Saccharopolyspora rhizosphaerae]
MSDRQGVPEDVTGAQGNTQRETTPLRRDNAYIRQDRQVAAPTPDHATRPVITHSPTPQQPHQGPQQSYPGTSRQPAPPPPPPQARRQGVTPVGWALRGLVLVLIAVVSGLIWSAIKPDDEAAAPPPPKLRYDFTLVRKEEAFQGCKNVSDDDIQKFFGKQECDHLTRALYTTTLPDGRRVLTSVITVLMPTPQVATQLNALTTKDGTGNIRDLVEDERDGTKGMPSLNDAAYASARQDRLVVIGDSAFYGKSSKKDPALSDVTNEALKLGWPQDQAPK